MRDPSRAPALLGAEVAGASYADTDAARAALTGLQVVFMVSAAEAADRLDQHRAFIDAAAAAGVEHLVYTSFAAASERSTFTLGRDHWVTEEHIRRSGMRFTFLRDNFYADFLSMMVADDGAIRGPAGDGRVAAVAVDDVADVAASVLLDAQRYADTTATLTGPESLTLEDVARVLTATLGRPVRYVPETVEEAYSSRQSYGAPQWQLDAWVSTYTAIASGEVAEVTGDVARIAGHEPTTLAELLATGRSAYP